MLTGTELADLARRTRSMSLRFDQVRRDTEWFDMTGCPQSARRVAELAADAATLTELEGLVAALQRAEREERPASSARRSGFYARTLEAMGRLTPSPDRTVRLSGDRRA